MIAAQHFMVVIASNGVIDSWFACAAGRPHTLCRRDLGCSVVDDWNRSERATDKLFEFDNWTVVNGLGEERNYTLVFTDKLHMYGDYKSNDDPVAFVVKIDSSGETLDQWDFVGEPVYVSIRSPWMSTFDDRYECPLEPSIRAEMVSETFPF